MNEKQYSRKQFLKTMAWIAALPYVLMALLAVRRHNHVSATPVRRLKRPESDGIYFMDDLILVKQDKQLQVFSARCTHLGCKINNAENNQLVCPCHGSAFSADGKVTRGPAAKGLTNLPYETDLDTGELLVKFKA